MTKLFLKNSFRDFRKEKNWSQKQMAEWITLQLDTAVSTQLIQKWEAGERSVNPDMAVELISLLKLGTEELFERR